jgi:hypothetical protein
MFSSAESRELAVRQAVHAARGDGGARRNRARRHAGDTGGPHGGAKNAW